MSLFVQAGVKVPSELLYTQSSNIVTGEIYQFYVIAQNDVGDSVPSDVLEAMAATVPNAVSLFTTTTQTQF